MSEPSLTEFLLARIAEDEAAARAVPPLDHNFDMGGTRQDERFIFDRTLPSSADGMGNWSKHRHGPATGAHFARHDPARVLAECEAKRRIVELHDHGDQACWEMHRGVYGPGWPEGSYAVEGQAWAHPSLECVPERNDPCDTIRLLALPYADHPEFRSEWRP